MKRFAAIAALTVAFATPVLAQTPTATPPTATPSAAPKSFSVETSTIGDLLDNPAAKAVFVKDVPDLANNPQIDMGRSMKLTDVVQYDPSLTPDKLAAIDADLKAIPPQ